LIKYDTPDSFRWGFELDRTTKERIECVKLLLDPNQPKPLYVPSVNTEAELKKLGKSAIAVATDYISAIFQHAMQKIESKYPKNYLDMLEKQYVLSVPAVWSDQAQDATLRVCAIVDLKISLITLLMSFFCPGSAQCWHRSCKADQRTRSCGPIYFALHGKQGPRGTQVVPISRSPI
jgi:hypothetical protein